MFAWWERFVCSGGVAARAAEMKAGGDIQRLRWQKCHT